MSTSITELMNIIDEAKLQMPEGVYLKIVNQLAEVYKNRPRGVLYGELYVRRQKQRIAELAGELETVTNIAAEQNESMEQVMEICRNKEIEFEATKRKLLMLTKLSKNQSKQIKEYRKLLK